MGLGFQVRGSWSVRRRKKKLQIGIHIVLTNYKYQLFLNTLTKINKFIFNTMLVGIYKFFEVEHSQGA